MVILLFSAGIGTVCIKNKRLSSKNTLFRIKNIQQYTTRQMGLPFAYSGGIQRKQEDEAFGATFAFYRVGFVYHLLQESFLPAPGAVSK